MGTLLCVYALNYGGVCCDGALYTFQALARIYPVELSNDLYLRYGSQDQFTVFSDLYAALIQAVGSGVAAVMLTLLSLFALYAVTAYLFTHWLPGEQALWTVFPGAITWVSYGAFLRANEASITPRTLAEAAGLLSLGFAIRSRWSGAIMAGLIALLTHPLIALPAIGLVLLMFLHRAQWIWLMLGGLVVMAVFAFEEPAIWHQLSLVMDPEWRGLIMLRQPFLFLSEWRLREWDMAAVTLGGCALVASRLTGSLRRLFWLANAVGGIGLMVAYIGGDLLSNALMIQVQTWRSLWIPAWLSMAGVAVLLLQYDRDRNQCDLLALMGLLAAILLNGSVGGFAVVLAFCAVNLQQHSNGKTVAKGALLACGLFLACAVWWHFMEEPPDAGQEPRPAFWFLNDPAVIGFVTLIYFFWRERISDRIRNVFILPVVASMVVGVSSRVVWNRLNYERDLFAPMLEEQEILSRLPRGGSILWAADDKALRPWFSLKYPSYLSGAQTAGIVFFREGAIESRRRSELLQSVLNARMPYMRWPSSPEMRKEALDVKPESISGLCRDSKLSAVFLPGDLPPIKGALAVQAQRGFMPGQLVFCDGYTKGQDETPKL